MIILDTYHINVLQAGVGSAYDTLVARMLASPDQDYRTTVVTFEEQVRGWLAEVQRTQTVAKQVRPYDRLLGLVSFFSSWKPLRFSETAATLFAGFRQQKIRVGSLDLKIASIVTEHRALLLTANLRDFEAVPGLRLADWLHEDKHQEFRSRSDAE